MCAVWVRELACLSWAAESILGYHSDSLSGDLWRGLETSVLLVLDITKRCCAQHLPKFPTWNSRSIVMLKTKSKNSNNSARYGWAEGGYLQEHGTWKVENCSALPENHKTLPYSINPSIRLINPPKNNEFPGRKKFQFRAKSSKMNRFKGMVN